MSHEGGHRHSRLQQLIREELESLLRDEVSDPRLDDVRCTRVELSVDYRSARVHFLLPPEREQPAELSKVARAFDRAAAFLRARLGEALDLKRVPQLSFRYDRDAAEEERGQKELSAFSRQPSASEQNQESGQDQDENEDQDQRS
jgi:ribosome-binding factor A